MFKRKQTNPVIRYDLPDDISFKLTPIKQVIPKWYKDTPQFLSGDSPKFFPDKNLGIKYCMPFLDGLTTGYAVLLNCDVLVEQTIEGPFLSWGTGTPLSVRSVQHSDTFPIPEGHSNIHFIWKLPLVFSLPKKYSVLFTHPLNRYDLPFTTLSAVIDGGFAVSSGNVPFFIKNTFEGVIPRGTPIAQLVPFLRQNWSSVHDTSLYEASKVYKNLSDSKLTGWYKQNKWNKKEYT